MCVKYSLSSATVCCAVSFSDSVVKSREVAEQDRQLERLAPELDGTAEHVLEHFLGHVLAHRDAQLVAFAQAIDHRVETLHEIFELVAGLHGVDLHVVLLLESAHRRVDPRERGGHARRESPADPQCDDRRAEHDQRGDPQVTFARSA